MMLIENAGRAWRLFTVQIGAVAIAWGMLPAETQAAVLSMVGVPAERIPALLGVAFIVARLLKQMRWGGNANDQ